MRTYNLCLPLLVLLVLTFEIKDVRCAKILGVFHMAAYSHFQLGDKLFKTLASRGHEVTVISPYKEDNPPINFKQVILTGVKEEIEKAKKNLFDVPNYSSLETLIWLDGLGFHITELMLSHPNVRNLLRRKEHFDLVIVEQFINEAARGLCHYFNAPCVLVNPTGANHWCNRQMGNPEPPSYVPFLSLKYSSDMNFFERFYNSLIYVGGELFFHFVTMPRQNALLKKYIPGAPDLYDLYYNTSMMLVNGHVSVNSPVPLVPNMIDIAGYHVNPPKELPRDLQEYLDNSTNGVIYFNMGSNLKSKDMPVKKVRAILSSFSKVKQNVLWKWEDEHLPEKPPNVKIAKWLPQQDVLAHQNIKLFITHGGGLSSIETIYHGVPVIGIPVFGDQEGNVENARLSGYALKVPYNDLNENTLSDALFEILNNPKYADNAKMRSRIMHDQPQKPLDRAMFWIEYVLRHRGAPHLRTAALTLTWYQYLLLDVVAVVLIALTTITFLIYASVKMLVRKKAPAITTGKKVNKERNKKRNKKLNNKRD